MRWLDFTYSHQVIINTDGTSKGSPGLIATGGIHRTFQEDLRAAFSSYLGNYVTNGFAEASALFQGIKLAAERGLTHFFIHSDSLMIVNIVLGKIHAPRRLDRIIQEIKHWVQHLHIQVMHIFRVANAVTDALANHGCDTATSCYFSALSSLPNLIRGLCILDKRGTPYMRRQGYL